MAGCGCGKPASLATMLPMTAKAPAGMYMLAGYDTCTELYRGERSGDAVHVVATGTPNERLFLWDDWKQASDYAVEMNVVQIDNVPVTSLCRQAVEDLYADAA